MPRPRFQKLDPKKRERILEVSAREFARHGYEGASLNHILETAGISKGAAYYYFDSKADLFTTVVARYFAEFFAGLEGELPAMTRKTFWPRLEAFYRRSIATYAEQPWMLGLMRAIWRLPRDSAAGGPLQALMAEGQAWTAELVRRGRALGAIRGDLPGELLALWFMALDTISDRWMADHLTRLDEGVVEEMVALTMDTLHRLLDPPPHPRRWSFLAEDPVRTATPDTDASDPREEKKPRRKGARR